MNRSVLKEPRNFINMLYICTEFEQLNVLIVPITQDYLENIPIHVCQLTHRDVLCCNYAEMMHDGSHPNITMIYIPRKLKSGAQVIIDQLQANIPNQEANNEEDDFIFTCPGCGTPFSEQ